MARAPAGNLHPGSRTGVRIVIAGDRGTGKSSLIVTAAADNFPVNVPPVLPPTRLPEDFYPDRVPTTIIDTSSRTEDSAKVAEELKRADAVVLTYACDQPQTLDRLSTFWLPKLRQLEVRVPVIVVGCKLDLRDENQQVSLEQVMSPIMQQFREIETCIECSAFKHIQIPEVFYYAQKAVLHPTGPLFDQETQTLKPRCVRALKRIFILCDHDKDGALSDAELNDFQVKCFNAPLQPSEIVGVKRVVQEKLPEGVNDRGLTLTGFLFLHALFIEKGRLETTWTVLRKFGYDNDIKLADELIPALGKRAPDQSVELTNEAIEFLRGIFELYDGDGDGALRPRDLEELFSTAPESPWNEAPYRDSAERNAMGGLSIDDFLSLWSLMTLLDPVYTIENLIYIGYSGDPASSVRVTRKRRLDRKKQQLDRNVLQCFVFGPKKAGKSALLDAFLARPFSETYTPTTEERYAVNVVDQPGGPKKTLILREIPEDGVKKLLSGKESLAACDIALFVHDSSDESSWKKATDLLVEVASHGEDTGYEVPCLIVAAKDDLDSFPLAIQDSTRVSQDMGIEAPIPISTKLGDFNSVFRRIASAAEHPHLSIPETEAGRSRKQYHKLINRSLMFVSGITERDSSVQHMTSLFPTFGHMQTQPLRPPPPLHLHQPFHNQTTPGMVTAVPQPPQVRPRVRARRGQATDPHSIAERLRRARIAERRKALQELVPSCNKTDRAAMLDEIVDYVKFLRLQVKVLSMSRLRGAGAVAQLVADVPLSSVEGEGIESGNNQQAWENWSSDGTEQQVAKLMEEDVGAAMQFLQSKALCIMPISLASAIFRTHQADPPIIVKPEMNTP